MAPQQEPTWTVKAILDWCEGYLASHGDAQPRLSAQYLLGEAMGLSRIELYTNLDKPLSMDERATMREWVRRRGEGEPLQLICGTAPFRHMVLRVEPGVLIPRPETEVLVSEVLAHFPPPKQVSAFAFEESAEQDLEPEPDPSIKIIEVDNFAKPNNGQEHPDISESGEGFKNEILTSGPADSQDAPSQTIRVIDLCTGSGCIACALATEHSNMEVLALDIAPEALSLAQRNVDEQGVAEHVKVIESDLLSVPMRDSINLGAFDAIVSNPPYIPSAVVDTLDAEVSEFEPRLALDGGADGLELFRRFVGDAFAILKPGGILAVELFEDSLYDALKIAQSSGFSQTRIVKDLVNKDRILIATK